MTPVLWAAWLALAPAAQARDEADAAPLVDLNTADVATLSTLPGIGPKKAEGIVVLRQRRPLTRVTQLLQVRGIGPRLLERLRGRVTLRPAPATVFVDPRTTASGFQHDALRARGTFVVP